jgi:hypothetical protein
LKAYFQARYSIPYIGITSVSFTREEYVYNCAIQPKKAKLGEYHLREERRLSGEGKSIK